MTALRPQLNKRTFYTILAIAALSLTSAYLLIEKSSNGAREYDIDMRDGTFYPAEITIKTGDTVHFTNKTQRGVWPASDPHPTHDYLSGFDPRVAVAPGDTWSYTFTESGTWRYHDHLAVTMQGIITVLDGKNDVAARTVAKDGYCDGECFDEAIRKLVHEKGIDAAYALFKETYESGNLPRGCHWTAHQIGEAAYELFKEGEDFPISYATTYCGYGFYHGFMESLLRENPDPEYALDFCDQVQEKLGLLGLQNCYHGIGHGFTEDPPDPQTEGDFDAMIQPGTKVCEFLFGDNFVNLNLCLTGVFTVPAGFAAEDTYGLHIDPKRPFAYCESKPIRYKKACYGEFTPKLDEVLQWDLKKLPLFVESIPDERLQRLVTWVAPSVFMARDILNDDHTRYIDDCRQAFSGKLREVCWGGTILGFFQHGEPEKQYEKAFAFCRSRGWRTETERTFCESEVFHQMQQNYTMDLIRSVCRENPKGYTSYCQKPEERYPSAYDDPVFD